MLTGQILSRGIRRLGLATRLAPLVGPGSQNDVADELHERDHPKAWMMTFAQIIEFITDFEH
jgi:hypothetical protein